MVDMGSLGGKRGNPRGYKVISRKVKIGASTMPQLSNPPLVSTIIPNEQWFCFGSSTSHPAPYFWPGKALEDGPNPWTLKLLGDPEEATGC